MNTFRNTCSIVTAIGVILILSSCPGGPEKESEIFAVSPTTITLDGDNQSTFQITSSSAWTIRTTDFWLTVSSFSGSGNSQVTVKATSENTSQQTRNAQLIITESSNSEMCIITVYQPPKSASDITPALKVDMSSITFESSGGEKSFEITSNQNWVISSSEGWCSVSPTSGINNAKISVSVPTNNTNSVRTATITVKSSNGDVPPCTIQVSQQSGAGTESKPGEDDNTLPNYIRKKD